MNKFTPSYTVNGIELTEISQACPTSSCLSYANGNLFEMQAKAEDKDGNLYYVTWLFEDNGEESLDEYDYSQPYDCTLIE